MSEEAIYSLGLTWDGVPATPPMQPRELADLLMNRSTSGETSALQKHFEQRKNKYLDVVPGVDVKKISSAGWGVVCHQDEKSEILTMLKPLLDRRAKQAGDLYQCIAGEKGYQKGENKAAFLRRFKSGSGPVNPEKLPYYLLIVGDPEMIPFRFQTQLDVQFAVGRIHFDNLEDYKTYAEAVVAVEEAAEKTPQEPGMALWATRHDKATELGHQLFMQPLKKNLAKHQPHWQIDDYFGERANKANLKNLIGGEQATSLLVSLSHGLMQERHIKANDKGMKIHQGSLVCAEWPGEHHSMDTTHMLRPHDLDTSLHPKGLIWINFSCFSGGTPIREDIAPGKDRILLAEKPFVNGLAQRLLGHENGGALAVVGHVERLWLHSFREVEGQSHFEAHQSMIDALLDDYPVGAALEHINQRYAELATDMVNLLEELEWGEDIDSSQLATSWCAHNDARGYVVFGDPAVRLPVKKKASEQQ